MSQTDGTVQRDDGVHSESDVSIVEETPDVGELLQPGAGTDMGPTAGWAKAVHVLQKLEAAEQP